MKTMYRFNHEKNKDYLLEIEDGQINLLTNQIYNKELHRWDKMIETDNIRLYEDTKKRPRINN